MISMLLVTNKRVCTAPLMLINQTMRLYAVPKVKQYLQFYFQANAEVQQQSVGAADNFSLQSD